MDSSQVDYFKALKIPINFIRNQLEVTTATKNITVGQKINLSEINLKKILKIKPYPLLHMFPYKPMLIILLVILSEISVLYL